MPAVHFTSDTHFLQRLMARERGYAPGAGSTRDVTGEQVVAHDEAIIAIWNRHVQPEDIVWHLGDLALVAPRRLAGIVPRLNGRIRLVLGNHDRAHPLFGEKSIGALRETLGLGIEWAGTFATVKIAPTKELARRNGPVPHRVALSHFPYTADRTDDPRETQWRLRDEGAVLLHGHTHAASATGAPRQIHVGWDAWRRPVAAHELSHIIEADVAIGS
ncbi:metallophosphoesterase [Brachybacterium sacelli]|uniref:Calcineurin-like phosphoesterase family protein n=1 Tax=Brachybacterium sacelli TaxID=173364 RepID=A0ABS4X5Z7_9MICO|nr:metallophosphoesterase [Brachybacterium sacelli]MBP2383791.1 calcineurin-like phosphoesterase family protein [Brachybacterium sacelli]